MNDLRLITPPKLARMAGVSPDKILEWIADGSLKAVNLSQSSRPRWKVRLADWETFLDGRSNQPKATRRRRRDVPSATKSYV